MDGTATVLLVSGQPDSLARWGLWAEDAGYEVTACPGPHGPSGCIGLRGRCPLAADADAVVLDMDIPEPHGGGILLARRILASYLALGRRVIALGADVSYGAPRSSGRLFPMDPAPTRPELVSALRSATTDEEDEMSTNAAVDSEHAPDEETSGLSAFQGSLGTVREAMTASVVTVPATMSVAAAARELERAGVAGAPVVEAKRVVGVVTLSDMLALAGIGPYVTSGPFLRVEHVLADEAHDVRVRDVMSANAVTVHPDAPVTLAALTMEESGVDRLPVVDARGAPIGIITRQDVVAALARPAPDGGSFRPSWIRRD